MRQPLPLWAAHLPPHVPAPEITGCWVTFGEWRYLSLVKESSGLASRTGGSSEKWVLSSLTRAWARVWRERWAGSWRGSRALPLASRGPVGGAEAGLQQQGHGTGTPRGQTQRLALRSTA